MRRSPLIATVLCVVFVGAGCSKQVKEEAPVGYGSATLDRMEVTGSSIDAGQYAPEDLEMDSARRAQRHREVPAPARSSSPVLLDAPTPMAIAASPPAPPSPPAAPPADFGADESNVPSVYAHSPLQQVADHPVSTFSIDVDTGSYALARRYLREGALPPRNLVRTEEFLNYFDYGYTPPASTVRPFSVTLELAPAPWNSQRQLLLVGIKGYEVDQTRLPPANLVFLIDTSGSMMGADRLDLLKQGFRALVQRLRAIDRVAIVTYAGSAGLVLPSTAGDQHGRILAALEQLEAGGATAGEAGIELAYSVAQANRIAAGINRAGINRVILATDGDFNVGQSSVDALKHLIAERRASGIALTTLGVGYGNYNDELSEQLADIGNGNHAYIDDLAEARKVLVKEMGATLLTIAKDVKVQVEFDPRQVQDYRLLGYENRALRREDFDNDAVDAGEIGAGHDVTALYEISLHSPTSRGAAAAARIASVRLRYKHPDDDRSQLIEGVLARSAMQNEPSDRLRFAAAVGGFAERLRHSDTLGDFSYAQLADLARGSGAPAKDDERAELIDLIELADALEPALELAALPGVKCGSEGARPAQ